MKRTVRVFAIPKERVPGGPPDPAREVVVEASSLDGILAATRNKLTQEGYRIRAARGLEDAAALAELHGESFGSTWTAEMYSRLMQSPGYDAEREFVVEAPDGGFAAFTVTWHDHVNRIGHFEPVGTHPDHRRRGLARALLMFGLRAMAEAGMEHAIVSNMGDNEASRDLYLDAGFEPWHLVDGYTKPIPG